MDVRSRMNFIVAICLQKVYIRTNESFPEKSHERARPLILLCEWACASRQYER